MYFMKISFLLSEVNKQKLLSKNFGENKVFELEGEPKNIDYLLCDSENLDSVIEINKNSFPIILFEEVILNNIFQAHQGIIQITSLDVLEEDIVKYINIGDSFNHREFIGRKICDSTLSLGKVFDELIKKIHLEDLQVFNLIFTFSWMSIFLSQLFKEKVFDLPFEVSFDKKDNDLRLNIKCYLKTSLSEVFDGAFSGSESNFFTQSFHKLLEHVNFMFVNEDIQERIFELDAIILSNDFFPKIFGHKLPSMYERNKERYNFYSPFLELLSPLSDDDSDKVMLRKGFPSESIEKSSLYERGKLGLEEIAFALKTQLDFLYPNEELTNDLCRRLLSKLGFNNNKVTNEEISALINLVENHSALETFVDLKNAAFEQGGNLLNINEDLVTYIKDLNEVDLVNLNILGREGQNEETESFLIKGSLEEGVEKIVVPGKGEDLDDPQDQNVIQDILTEDEPVEDFSIRGSSSEIEFTRVENIGDESSSSSLTEKENSYSRKIKEIEDSEKEIERRIKGLKEDLTEEIIRVSGKGENVDQDQFRVMFLEHAKKHFSIVTKVAEEAGNDIFKSVVSKNIDEGLMSHDPKFFNQKIINLSSEIVEKDQRIKQLENELRESIEGNKKDLHPGLKGLTEEKEEDINKEIRVKNKVINLLEKKIESLERKNETKLFELPEVEQEDYEKLKSDVIVAKERAESFKSLASEMTNRLKKNNQEINELKTRINKSLNSEKRLTISLKRSEDARQNLAKEKMILNKKIVLMKKEKEESSGQEFIETESLNDKVDNNKAKNNLKLLESKNRHLETYSLKLKENLSEMNSLYQSAKKESHKHKLQIKLLEQQIKNLIKRSA